MLLTPEQRFYNKIDWGGPLYKGTPCLLWTASLYSEGYGQFWDGERRLSAHKWHWEYCFGPVPPEDEKGNRLVLDHGCHNAEVASCPGGPACVHRRCVNLIHLDVVTHRANVLAGGLEAAKLFRSGKCAKGHIKEPGTVYVLKSGEERCKTCQTEYRRASAARRPRKR